MLAARRFVFFDVIFMSRKVEISLALRINDGYADESDSSLASRRRMVAKALGSLADAPAHLLDDLHKSLQSNRRIFASPCDTAFRRHRGIDWPEHHIFVVEFF
jgi:hypothetical protein